MGAASVEIAPGVYWLGSRDQSSDLQCNPYLVVDGDEGILIDPGSVLDFQEVAANLSSVIPLSKIRNIVLHHQDPDLVSSVPLFEKAGFQGRLACHWRASVLIRYYGVSSDFYRIEEHSNRLAFASGRELHFIPTPYLHFPGAIMTYDPKSRVLFSSDLFGAFSHEWSLYADGKRYMEAMKAFHEHYMPSNDILRPVMENLLQLDVSMIAPQHGSIIKTDIRDYVAALRDLECGSLLHAVRKDLEAAGGYTGLCGQVIRRFAGIFARGEILSAFEGSGIVLDRETLDVADFNSTGGELWDRFFEVILARKGGEWLMMAEVLVDRISGEYGVPLPAVYRTRIAQAKREIDRLVAQKEQLQGARRELERRLRDTEANLVRDPLTGLYNDEFFKRFLELEVSGWNQDDAGPALMILSIDGMSEFIIRYGDALGDEAVRSMAYFIKERLEGKATLFRLPGAAFAVFLPDAGAAESVHAAAESIRTAVGESRLFLESFTVSIGAVRLAEMVRAGASDPADLPRFFLTAAKARALAAKQAGMNRVVSTPHGLGREGTARTVVVAETDAAHGEVLRDALEGAGFRVLPAADGQALLERIEGDRPDFVVSELMLPKLDAFAVRQRMLASSELKSIPFLLLSHKKDEETLARAQALGIEHYIRKPYLLSELIGIVRLRAARADDSL